jgi:hypothetical protein
MSNGSFPVPRQKAQTTSSNRHVFTLSVDGMIPFPSSWPRATVARSVTSRPGVLDG